MKEVLAFNAEELGGESQVSDDDALPLRIQMMTSEAVLLLTCAGLFMVSKVSGEEGSSAEGRWQQVADALMIWSLVVLAMDEEDAGLRIQVMIGGNGCAAEGLKWLSASGRMFIGGLLLRIHVMTGSDECTAEGGAGGVSSLNASTIGQTPSSRTGWTSWVVLLSMDAVA